MSHEFESGAFRKPAWHRLGNVVDRLMTVKEALIEGGLDWLVEKRPLYVLAGGSRSEVPVYEESGIYANYRLSDGKRVSDGLSEEYEPIQNIDSFMLFDEIIDAGKAKVSATTSLNEGRIVTITAELNREINVPEEVGKIVPFLNLVTSHDTSYALMICPNDVEVVCANTLRLSLSRVGFPRYTVRHVKNAEVKIEEIRKAVGLADTYYDELEVEVAALVNQTVSEDEVQAILGKVFPSQDTGVLNRNSLAVRGLYESAPYIRPFIGTGWGILNAVNEFELWTKPMKEEAKRAESQARDLLSSAGLKLTAATHKLLVAAR